MKAGLLASFSLVAGVLAAPAANEQHGAHQHHHHHKREPDYVSLLTDRSADPF